MSPGERALAGRSALVTGGGRGLGAEVAVHLARMGARVWLGYRADEEKARATQARITDHGGRADLAPGNLADPHEIQRVAETVGDVDILVHGAALGSFKPTLGLRAGQWDLSLHVGARALLLLARELADSLVDGGSIVALSSLGGRRAVESYGAIGIDKAAVEATVRYLAAELGPRGVRVNGVAAGALEEGSLHLHPGSSALLARARERAPLRRLVTAAEVAHLVGFLVGPGAGGVQGQTIVCDAGLTVVL